jgi:type II secretory pathway pseudopilin PulG
MRAPSPLRAAAGFTFVELVVGMAVLATAVLILSSVVGSLAQQRTVNRETALAVAAARNVLETLRSEDFGLVFARYNADPADDPGGAGSAPGARFAVPGLAPTTDAADGLTGEVQFPSVAGPGGVELREDVELRVLGMPRDLSGDHVIDAADHGEGYFILPVQVRVRWQSPNGPRAYAMATQLSPYRKP